MGKIINILFIVLAVILVACGEDAEPTEEIAERRLPQLLKQRPIYLFHCHPKSN